MAGAGTHYDVRTRFELTNRQREVLDLIARGYTNAQIGDELGITLDGAKWHVSEIIGKLGVSSREQAAEYWLEYNRPTSRLSRMFGGLASVSIVRWAGLGFASVVAAGGIATGVVLMDSGETPADGATPIATETPPPGDETPTPDAVPTTEAVELTEGDPVPLPESVVLYYHGGFFPREGRPETLSRAHTSGGAVVIDDIYAAGIRD